MMTLIPSHNGYSLSVDNANEGVDTLPLPAFLIGTRWVKANGSDPAYLIINGTKHKMISPWHDPAAMTGSDFYEFELTINDRFFLFCADDEQKHLTIHETDEDGEPIVEFVLGKNIIIGSQ